MLPSIIIFVITYFFIASEKMDKMLAAVLGATAAILCQQIHYEEAFAMIDLNVLFLLIGMMIVVQVLAKTGVFEWVAITVAQKAKGSGIKLLIFLLLVTAFMSAFLDNVTTVIIIAPITILICQFLDLKAIPFLILEALFSNIGGTGTLVGDPPNIIIGSASHLGFNDFLIHLGPPALLVLAVGLVMVALINRKSFIVTDVAKRRLMDAQPELAILEPRKLRYALIVLGLIFVGFFTSHLLHAETGIIALGGSFLMLLVCRSNPHKALAGVEWNTILFFSGLFMLVGSLEANGLFELVGEKIVDWTDGNLLLACIVILWATAIFSAFLDNIPMVISTIPVIQTVVPVFAAQMGLEVGSMDAQVLVADPLYFSLALGACLGGNGTIVGASANVVIVQIAHRNGYSISFWEFMRVGMPTVFLSVIISSVYIYLRYMPSW